MEQVERLIVASLPRRLTDTALAKETSASIGDLRRAFLDIRNTTMYQALYRLRLETVRRTLEKDPTRDPRVVAFECGFGHYGVFHRRYRRFLAEREAATEAAPPSLAPDVPTPGS